MGWWSKVLPDQEVDVDALQVAIAENKAEVLKTIRNSRESKRQSRDVIKIAQDALDVLDKAAEKTELRRQGRE